MSAVSHKGRAGILLVIVCAAAASLTCCARESAKPKGTSPRWTTHTDPLGFTVQHPKGWTVAARDSNIILISNKEKDSFVLISPFILDAAGSARKYAVGVPRRYEAMFPKAELYKLDQQRTSPDELIGSINYGPSSSRGQANFICSAIGRSGVVYAIAAPKSTFAQRKQELVRVLQSFKFTEPSKTAKKPAPEASITYVKWTDPKEGAFTLDVPKGWKVEGGLIRRAPIDTVVAVLMTSPDEKIRVGIGDHEVPVYTLPSQSLTMSGLTEGTRYGTGFQTVVMHYIPGVQFVKQYVDTRLKSATTGLKCTSEKSNPLLAATLQRLYPVSGAWDVGEACYTFKMGGQEKVGYCFAGTMRMELLWIVPFLGSYIASPDQEGLASAVLERSFLSYKETPSWTNMQTNIAGQASRITSQTNNEISDMLDQSYHRREQSRGESARNYSNATLGVTDVRDPDTGETWKATGGSNYYWRETGTNTIAGTRTSEPPSIDFRPLEEY